MNSKTQGFLRHLLTALGGIAVTYGWLDEQTVTQVVGAGVGLLGFIWSWIAPEKKLA